MYGKRNIHNLINIQSNSLIFYVISLYMYKIPVYKQFENHAVNTTAG